MIELHFDTPDNACQSLRIIAEKLRTGSWRLMGNSVIVVPGNLHLTLDLLTDGATVQRPPEARAGISGSSPGPARHRRKP